MKSIVDFIVDATKDSKLAEEFHDLVQKVDHSKLAAWFHGKGYDIKADEAKKLVENKDSIKSAKLGFTY